MLPVMQLLCRSGTLGSRLCQLGTMAPSYSSFLHTVPWSAATCTRCLNTLHNRVICRTRNFSSQPSKNLLPLFTSIIGRVKGSINRTSILWVSTQKPATGLSNKSNKTVFIYIASVFIAMIGVSYAGVPLYRMFCAATGFGGVPITGHESKLDSLTPVKERILTIKFNADTASSMQWSFRPQQPEVTVVPGETALAFYKAKNPTDKPILGISTYNVIPYEAGPYFNKIQCFCFEEQRLNPHEEVDMPVFFYIDPDIMDDPRLEKIDQITLSYTFFESKEGMTVPLPGYMQAEQ